MQLNKPVRDFAYYLAGSLVVALVAIVRLPVFTSYFSPAELGLFSLVSITYTYFSLVIYNWITSCIYRFYHAYRHDHDPHVFVTNIVFLLLLSSLLLFLISTGWYLVAGSKTERNLVILAFFYLLLTQLFSMFMVVFKLQGKPVRYNVYQAVQAVLSFLVVLFLIFRMKFRIEAIFGGSIIITLLLLTVLLVRHRTLLQRLSPAYLSMSLVKRFLKYGFVGFLSAAGVYILVSSDRYIIALYEDISRVGIYNQVYQVGQVSIYFLVTVFFNAITPGFIKLLTGDDPDKGKQLEGYIKAFMLLVLPVTFYLSLFSKQVAEFLLGAAFRGGYTMIPWIMASSLLYGMALFNETKLKFENRYKPIVQGVFLACMLNVGLNFLVIPRLGYTWAAVTTFFAYIFLYVFYYFSDNLRYLRLRSLRAPLIISIVLGMQLLADLALRQGFGLEINKWLTLAEAILFMTIYAVAIWRLRLTGNLFG
jgi:O-antigen/teichoic acid export membrane protein